MPVLLITPKSELPAVAPGLLNAVWLKLLKVSKRNCIAALSENWNALNNDMFQLFRPGPTTLFRATVPHCRGPGLTNDEVLNHCCGVFV